MNIFYKKQDLKGTYFFFSSRRRHTRSTRDWSSDVCSSDLAGRGRAVGFQERMRRTRLRQETPVGEIEPRAVDLQARSRHDEGFVVLVVTLAVLELRQSRQRVVDHLIVARPLSGEEPARE